jgi:hypothetical protein
MKKIAWRILRITILLLAALAILAPFIPAAFLRGRAEAALARSLNRPVEIGDIRFTFFPAGPVPGPGFALEDVTIHEDPRAGIEPFAYMKELGASVRVFSLLRGHLEFSGLNLGDASINLVKTDQGPWNFQHLLNGLQEEKSSIPALRMRGGRINFKFGDTKSVFFFREADLDVSPTSWGAIDLRFSGAPSRTDHTKQDFGRLYVRGSTSASSEFDFQVELQRSSLEETLRLMDPQGFGVHGVLAMNAHLAGPPNNIQIAGDLRIGDVHRWDLLPESNQTWRLPFNGVLDLRNERLELRSTPDSPSPLTVEFRAYDYLSTPRWSTSVDFNSVPMATLIEVARHMGATMPENLAVEGSASGSASYDQHNGVTGTLALKTASLTMPDQAPIEAEEATIEIHGGAVHLLPATVVLPPSQSAQLEGSIMLAYPHELDLRLTTKGLTVGSMRPFGLAPISILGETAKGTWRGTARYQDEKWTADAELHDSEITISGLSEPVAIASAALILAPNRLTLNRIRGTVGAIAFNGSYDARGTQMPRLTLSIAEADLIEIEHLFAPTLARAGPGFFARTLRLSSSPPPEWLKARKLNGSIAIDQLKIGERGTEHIQVELAWNGPLVSIDVDGSLTGALIIDLTRPATSYRVEGGLKDISLVLPDTESTTKLQQ